MAESLRSTKRPIVYSISYFGLEAAWAKDAGANMWRIGQDSEDRWNNVTYYSFGRLGGSRPGAWPDPDMITAGLGGMTETEYRTQFNL